MKKKVLSVVIATIIAITAITSTGFVVKATPVTEVQGEYKAIQEKINSLNLKIQELDEQITPLVNKINTNKIQIENINKEIENTNKEIKATKIELSEKEEVLGKRLREVYKTGGQTSYISLIFSADSFSDLISKIDSASRIVNIDQKVVEDIVADKDKLDEKVASLEVKANQIVKVNEEVEKQKIEFDKKKDEQQPIIDQAKAEQAEYDKVNLAPAERGLVSDAIATCNNSESSYSQLESAISNLRDMRDNQIKSPIVKAEINAAIEKAKDSKGKLENSQKALDHNRGGGTISKEGQAIVDFAMKFLGRDYVYGASGPTNFDCSGLTSYVYSHAGIDIGRDTYAQVGAGRAVSRDELQPGDLVLTSAGHVGIYVGNGNMIHAPQTGDQVKVSPIWSFYSGRRILN